MTAAAGASANFTFDKSIYSDPSMRAHLKKIYTAKYAPVHERIQAMKDAEANNEASKTVRTQDGKIATELSAAQYEAAIPSFEKWLDLQQNTLSPFDLLQQSKTLMERIKDSDQPLTDFYQKQVQNLNEMKAFLIQSMEETQNEEAAQATKTQAANDSTYTGSKEEDPVAAFLAYLEMSADERYIAQALAGKGYTQEEFEALPPEEQKKIMDEIREELKGKTEEQAKSGEAIVT